MPISRLSKDARAVSPVVGFVLILGMVAGVSLGVFIFGQSLIDDASNQRVDSRFTFDAENQTHINIVSAGGESFSSSDTDRLYVMGTNSTGQPFQLELYNQSQSVETGNATLAADSVVINSDRANANGIDPGSSMQFVWVPEGQTGKSEVIIDELVIPSQSNIFVQKDQAGSVGGSVNISTGGCDPRENPNC
jgi:FlaG/FlaF family flagellin (archaellin)